MDSFSHSSHLPKFLKKNTPTHHARDHLKTKHLSKDDPVMNSEGFLSLDNY